MKKIVVWCNPYKKEFYYRIVSFHYRDYKVGYINSYGHFIVLVIPNIKTLEFTKYEFEFKGIDWESWKERREATNGIRSCHRNVSSN